MQSLPAFTSPGAWDIDNKSYAALGSIFTFILAFFTQSTASGGLHIVAYGLLLEVARRAFHYLYARLLIRKLIFSLCFVPLWKRASMFDGRTQGHCNIHTGGSRVRMGHAISCPCLFTFVIDSHLYEIRPPREYGEDLRTSTSPRSPRSASLLFRLVKTSWERSRAWISFPHGKYRICLGGIGIGSTYLADISAKWPWASGGILATHQH
jgi:hypothetical protein